MHLSYLDWRNFKRNFEFLLEKGLIAVTEDKRYKVSEKGQEYLERFQKLQKVLS